MSSPLTSRVLRIAVIVDGKVCDELHQSEPGRVSFGKGYRNLVALYDGYNKPKDYRKRAPLWLGLGALTFLAGVGLFGSEVAHYAERAAALASGEAVQELNDVFAKTKREGTGGAGLFLALFALIPFVLGLLGLQDSPPAKEELANDGSQSDSGRAAPTGHTLFDFKDGVYYLDLPEDARGKISLGKNNATVKQLRKRFGDGAKLRVKLGKNAKGKLLLGDTTVLFQMTAPAKVAPLPAFPVEFVDPMRHLRLSLMEFGIFGGSAAVLGSFFVLLSLMEGTEGEADKRFVEMMDLTVAQYEEEPEEELAEEEPEEEPVLKQEDKEKPKEKDPEDTEVLTEKPKEISQAAQEKARGVGIARVLGTYGGPGEGTVFDVMQSTENDLGKLFDAGMTQTIMSNGGDITAFVAGGEGISEHGALAKNEGLATGEGPADVGKTKKKERKVKGRLKSSTSDVYGDVDKKVVQATIRRRMSALQHCYEKALRSQPGLKGKHTYTITISAMGRVTKVQFEEDTLGNASVKACIKAKIKGWRFPAEGAEDSTDATFSVAFTGA